MPDTSPAGTQPSLASLVGGLIEDTQQLVRQEAALARREVKEEWERTKEASALMAGGLAVGAVVAILGAFTLVKLLQAYVLPQHEWLCFGIVTMLFALGGGLLISASMAKFNRVHLVPPQTAESLRQDVAAVGSAVGVGGPATPNLVRQR